MSCLTAAISFKSVISFLLSCCPLKLPPSVLFLFAVYFTVAATYSAVSPSAPFPSSSVKLSYGQMQHPHPYSGEEILKRRTPLLYNLEGRGKEGTQEVEGGRDEGAKGELWLRVVSIETVLLNSYFI